MTLKEGGLRGSLRNVGVGVSGIPDSGIAQYEWEEDVTDSWNDNDGTDNTSAGYSTDNVEGTYAKVFDGTDDYVDVGDLLGTPPFSIALWVKPSNDGTVTGLRTSNGDQVTISTDQITIEENGSFSQATPSNYLDTYNYYGLSFDGSLLARQDDATLTNDSDNATADVDVSGGSHYIGNLNDIEGGGSSLYLDGIVDTVEFYSKFLTEQEHSDRYNTGSI